MKPLQYFKVQTSQLKSVKTGVLILYIIHVLLNMTIYQQCSWNGKKRLHMRPKHPLTSLAKIFPLSSRYKTSLNQIKFFFKLYFQTEPLQRSSSMIAIMMHLAFTSRLLTYLHPSTSPCCRGRDPLCRAFEDNQQDQQEVLQSFTCLLYTSPSPRD